MHGRALFLVSLAATFTISACGRAPQHEDVPPARPEAPSTPQAVKPLAQKKFGAEITEKTSTSLDTLLQKPGQFEAKTVRTEGVVSAVCQSMGCWMEIADPAGQAHIKMAGHSFFVPKDASGHRAVVQGKVIRASNDECAEEAKQATGKVAKIELEATGVEFID